MVSDRKSLFFGGNYFARGEIVLYINHSGKYIEINSNMKIPFIYIFTHLFVCEFIYFINLFIYSFIYVPISLLIYFMVDPVALHSRHLTFVMTLVTIFKILYIAK